jgi:hypothetical protein
VTLPYLSGSGPVLLASGLWLGRGQKRPDDGTHFLQSRFPHQLLSPKAPLIHAFLLKIRAQLTHGRLVVHRVRRCCFPSARARVPRTNAQSTPITSASQQQPPALDGALG